MNRQAYEKKAYVLMIELRETEKQIAGLVNRKKQIQADMDDLQDQMVEGARNGRLDKEV